VVNREFCSHVAFTDSAIAAAKLEAVPQRLALILSHRLLIRVGARSRGQNCGQFGLNDSSFRLSLSQEIPQTLCQRFFATRQDFKRTILAFEGFSLLSEPIRGRSQIAGFVSFQFLNQQR
jgi:hypothetical protein